VRKKGSKNKEKVECQIAGCSKPAIHPLYKTYTDGPLANTKVWLHVCRHHEQMIGDENMVRAGGKVEKKVRIGVLKRLWCEKFGHLSTPSAYIEGSVCFRCGQILPANPWPRDGNV